MMWIVAIYLITSLISLIFIMILMKNAPEGYEDEDGCHIKDKEDDHKNTL